MIDLYYWPTPNGQKITLFLEEAGVPYTVRLVDIGKGEQFAPDFLRISPNNRMPAIVDHDPAGGGELVSVFESGAILLYLAEKTGRFLPSDPRRRVAALEWLFWQVGGLGPMLGQAGHFRNYAQVQIPYAIERYTNEADRLLGVLDRRLAGREYLADELSVADMACYPWVYAAKAVTGETYGEFPHVRAWLDRLGAREAVRRGMAVGKEVRKPLSDEAKAVLFNQTAKSTKR